MPENISGVPAGRSVFHLTSPFIGLLGNFAPRRPQSASAFQLPLCSPCCTSLLARLEFPVQEILRPQSGHVPENIYHRGVCPARDPSGVGNEIQNDWIDRKSKR